MRLRPWLIRLLGGAPPEPRPERGRLTEATVARSKERKLNPFPLLVPYDPHPVMARDDIFQPPKPGSKQAQAGVPEMAFDDGWFPDQAGFSFAEGIGFFGYQYLAELSQRSEYRKMVETLAMDMTREWIKLTYVGDDGEDGDVLEKLAALEAEFRRLKVQAVFREAVEKDGFFGRGHVYPDLGTKTDEELAKPLLIDKRKITKGSLRGLRLVEPTWVYPGTYNSTDPLHPHYYRPQDWYVMARRVHSTRLLTMVLRPVPDILKPAYMFGGMSLSQMAKPYVDNWLRTRQSVSDLVRSFTQFVLKTDLSGVISGTDAMGMVNRGDLFVTGRDNSGLMMINKGDGGTDTGEELTNVSAPLAGLDNLLSASQEQMSAVSGIPLVKLLGVTPSGLNASSDGEIRVYYDAVHAAQERLLRDPLHTVLRLAQLNLFGEIDEDIDFEFAPLWQMDEVQQAAARKSDADVDVGYVNVGVLDPVEVRGKLASDKDGPWANLDVEAAPEDPMEQAQLEALQNGEAPGGGPPGAAKPGGAEDEGFNEEDHPRAENGQFGSGSGGGSSSQGKTSASSGASLSLETVSKAEALWNDYGHGASIKQVSSGQKIREGSVNLNGSTLSSQDVENIHEAEKVLQAVAESSIVKTEHPWQGVWRGMALPTGADIKTRFKRNTIIEFDSLTAVSPDKGLAMGYTDPQYIGSESGEKVLFSIQRKGGVIGHSSGDETFPEAILPKGSRYRVASYAKQEDGTHLVTLYDKGDLNTLKQGQDSTLDPLRIKDIYERHGLVICVETPRGEVRYGRGWVSPPMAADYGYIDETWSSEGRAEHMDVFVGDRPSDTVYVIDQLDLATGQFDEHKLMMDFKSQEAAVKAYCDSYDRAGYNRIMAVTPCPVERLKRWLAAGDLYRPFSGGVGP